jgi:hypothetical protein
MSAEDHARNSVLREIILEHFFVGEVLKRLWQRRVFDVEILRSEFDAGGYDLVVNRGEIVRHIQLKSRLTTSSTREVSVGVRLADRPSGCVIWMVVDDALEFKDFLYFGSEPGKALPSISNMKTTKHVKANKDGIFMERPAHRTVPISQFKSLKTIDAVIDALLGEVCKRPVWPLCLSCCVEDSVHHRIMDTIGVFGGEGSEAADLVG